LGRTTTYTYDSNDGFRNSVVKYANGRTFTESATHNGRGQLLTKTDPNGQVTTYEYDDFGRISKIINPLGGTLEYDYAVYGDEGVAYGVDYAQYKKTTITEKTSISDTTYKTTYIIEYYDGFGFVYRTESEGDIEEGSPIAIVDKEKYYIGDQLMGRVSMPYFSGSPPQAWQQTTYDEFGRKFRIENPNYSIDYEYGLNEISKKTYHDESASTVVSTETFDIKGQLVRKTDEMGNATDYQYDSAGRLVKTILPLEQQSGTRQEINVAYDNFGRKSAIVDPSFGSTQYSYDVLGNTLTQTDSLNRIVKFEYDELDRLVAKRTNFGTADELLIAQYVYDDDNGFGNNYPTGRLSRIVDDSGTWKFAYDEGGNMTVKTREIDGLSGVYTEEVAYSLFGRPLEYRFPDGTIQRMDYTSSGNQKQVLIEQNGVEEVFASFSGYNASRLAQTKLLGNGVQTDYAYDITGRLATMQTCMPACDSGGSPTVLQDLAYDFNSSGKIEEIVDNRSVTTMYDDFGTMIDTKATQQFEYDELSRLKKAVWASDNEVLEYAYNEIGNLVKRSSTDNASNETFVDYAYQGQQVTEGYDDLVHDSSSRKFSAIYDSIGNMTRKTVVDSSGDTTIWDYEYDADNRLVRIHKNAVLPLESNIPVVELVYDYKGQRAIKIHNRDDFSTVTTWYVSPMYEIRKDSNSSEQATTKYVTTGISGKIASITQQASSQQAALMISNQHERFAGLLGLYSVRGVIGKVYHYFRSFINNPRSPLHIKRFLLLSIVFAFLFLVYLSRRKEKEIKFRSSFAPWQRYAALSMICVFFLVGCKDGDQTIQSHSTSPEGTKSIPRGVLNISGDTSDGVPDGTHYYHTNHIGSSSVVTDGNGSVKTYIVYEPFGKVAQHRSAGSNTITHKYTSQESDEESGLIYYNARYYDPNIGRFITADTIVPRADNAQAYNRYSYVVNNPIVYTDPSGHSWLSDIGKKVFKEFIGGVDMIVSAGEKLVK
ncbi:MAG: hypothetical protein GY866_35190, partial [Proteobacteria bacterium]|nr:hypothetical protein [Pseudomonadota bacterium]